MVWTGIHGGRTFLCTWCTDGHRISRRDSAASRHSAHECQQCNVSAWGCHTTCCTCYEFLQHHNVKTLLWPAGLSDLNPTELLWHALHHGMRRRNPTPQILPQLLTALQHEWQYIPRVVPRLIASTCRRCQAVIRVRSGYNRYWHFAYPYVTLMPVCTFHVHSQRYCFGYAQSNPLHMASWYLVACNMTTNFIKFRKLMFLSFFNLIYYGRGVSQVN